MKKNWCKKNWCKKGRPFQKGALLHQFCRKGWSKITWTSLVTVLKLNADMKFAKDLANMETLITDTSDYMQELATNMSINANGLTPSQEAVSTGITDLESSWRGGIADMTEDISTIDKEMEDQFNMVSMTLENIKNKLGARFFLQTISDTRRIQWRMGTVSMNGALTEKMVVINGNTIQFHLAGYYYFIVHAMVSPNARFQWKEVKNGRKLYCKLNFYLYF